MAIELKDYQKNAIKLAVNVPYNLILMQAGKGKSIVGSFYARVLFKQKLVDKIIYASTKTGVGSFKKAFKKRLGVDIKQYDTEEEFLRFLTSDEKICLIKHSMLEKIGMNENCLSAIRKYLTKHYKRIALVLDEAHKVSNDTTNGYFAVMNMRFMFERMSLHTATPYSSCLSQMYGLINIVSPGLYRSKRDFFDRHIEERIVRDWKTKKVIRKEKVCYHNLKELRENIEPFTFFYYPPLDLHFKTYHTKLADYTTYYDICMGILGKEDLEAIEQAKKEKERINVKENQTNS